MATGQPKPVFDYDWRRLVRNWNDFWFTPRDPTMLGFLRICTGAIFCYSLLVYSFSLPDFLGPHAWLDLPAAQEIATKPPMMTGALSGHENYPCAATTPEEEKYRQEFFDRFDVEPLCPHPKNDREAKICLDYRARYLFDLRGYGLAPPVNAKQYQDLIEYTEKYKQPMPPPYPQNQQDIDAVDDYYRRFGTDPRLCYSFGSPMFSIWYHVTDPLWMALTHAFFVAVAVMFMLGIGTRVTAVVAWFAAVSYIQRNTMVAYGVDTMMTIMLLYLSIAPSGAALSVDRWLGRWWKGRRPDGTLPPPAPPKVSVSANVALRLLQVHVCIIYAMAGLSKLQGNAWWNGNALWNVFGNFEFAPMNWELYHWMLRLLGSNLFVYELFMTIGVYFTLIFEIMYAVWIWRPSTRWIILSMAILLHGVIGIFMGLGTFALVMLLMNAAFLTDSELRWLLAQFGVEPPLAVQMSGGTP